MSNYAPLELHPGMVLVAPQGFSPLILTDRGMYYQHRYIEDAGEAHRLLINALACVTAGALSAATMERHFLFAAAHVRATDDPARWVVDFRANEDASEEAGRDFLDAVAENFSAQAERETEREL